MTKIKIVKMYPDVIFNGYAKEGDSGFDLCAYLKNEENTSLILRLAPHTTFLVKTGLKMQIPEGYEGQVRPRSGMAMDGLVVANSPGTVDSGFRGEVGILIHNNTDKMLFIQDKQRIAQMVIAPVAKADFAFVDELDTTDRGEGGFGSTGV